MRERKGWTVASLVVVLAACSEPSLNLPAQRQGVDVTFLPAAEPSAVPANFRARMRHAAGAEAWLFQGQLSEHHQRALRQGEVTASLQERAVPARYWSAEGDLWLQPLAWLAPGEQYSLALTGQGVIQVLDVERGEAPRFERAFPSAGRAAQRLAMSCGPRVPDDGLELELEPGRLPLSGRRLRLASGDECVAWLTEQDPAEPALPPPSIGDVLLPPVLFAPGAIADDAPACDDGTLLFGACLEVWDDRVLITAWGGDALWQLAEPVERVVVANAGRRTALVRGLSALSRVKLRGTVLTAAGQTHQLELEVTTRAPEPHLVLTEVLANPLGPEPASEWIELCNDSARPAPLAGIWLADGAGRVELPSEVLAPGEIALLVANAFIPSALDAPIPPETRLFRLASLGARGLSNSGEGLLLIGPDGVLSRFPSVSAVHAGRSVARSSLDASDDDPTAFEQPGASPGSASWSL